MSTTVHNRVFAELSPDGQRIEVHFQYDPDLVASIKEVPGARFVNVNMGGPMWLVPLELNIARRLREEVGDRLVLGRALKIWGKEAVEREKNLHALATVDDLPPSELKLNKKLPDLCKWFRPYQRADVKMLSVGSFLNLNEQRLGKTTEVIGAVFEADLENGPHLVVAPKTSLNTVWRFEIERWTAKLDKPHEVITYSGELTRTEREAAIDEFWSCVDEDYPVWFVCTPATVRDGKEPAVEEWNSFTIDEYHRTGLPNAGTKRGTGTKFADAVKDIKAKRRYGLTGTPMGGKPIKLWGGLHFLYPEQFSSKWQWAKQWLLVSSNGYGQDIGGIQYGREDDFYKALAPYAIRRLRKEVLPQLPDTQWIDVWCEMTTKQAKQYQEMARRAEVNIEDKQLNALGILAEYTRLKQFADAYCDEILEIPQTCKTCEGEGHIEYTMGNYTDCPHCGGTGKTIKLQVHPSSESGKLPFLLERLAENGIDPDDMEGDSVAVVASQFSSIVDMVHTYLNAKGIKSVKITGATPEEDRIAAQMLFRTDGDRKVGDARVICMTTTAGGVAITLDLADNVHILDETWVPDDQEQLADRVFNASRQHQVGVYVYRSIGTVEEYIKKVTKEKASVNKDILDLRRQGFRADMKEAMVLDGQDT
jgi:SNF2 family DNA or RNA helicase